MKGCSGCAAGRCCSFEPAPPHRIDKTHSLALLEHLGDTNYHTEVQLSLFFSYQFLSLACRQLYIQYHWMERHPYKTARYNASEFRNGVRVDTPHPIITGSFIAAASPSTPTQRSTAISEVRTGRERSQVAQQSPYSQMNANPSQWSPVINSQPAAPMLPKLSRGPTLRVSTYNSRNGASKPPQSRGLGLPR